MGIKDTVRHLPKLLQQAAQQLPKAAANPGQRFFDIINGRRQGGQQPPTEVQSPLPEAQPVNGNRLSAIAVYVRNRLQGETATPEMPEVAAHINTGNRDRILALLRRFQQEAKPEDIAKIDNNIERMRRGAIEQVWPKIQALVKMIRDPKAAWASKTLAIAALIYLISPLDAVPDIIPVLGLADDAAVIIAVFTTLAYQLDKYLGNYAQTAVTAAEEVADIQIKKYNQIIKISLIGSIGAAILAIIFKLIYNQI
ncbi:MAG: hypothetical protein Fur0025_07350 [Oscillatoriaceae cyanobacterium]